MSALQAPAEEPWTDRPALFLKSTPQLVWIACFDVDRSDGLARRLVDAHFVVRVLGECELRAEVPTPDLVVLDGDRASAEDWTFATCAHRHGTRVIVCFDATPAIWFIGAFRVLDGGPSQTRIVDTVIHDSRWSARSLWEGPQWIA